MGWHAAMGASVLTSPGGKLTVTIDASGDGLRWSVASGDVQVLAPSQIQAVVDGQPLVSGKGSVARRQSVNTTFATPVYRKQQVEDNYNLLVLKFAKGTSVEFRAYDDAAAYRIIAGNKKAGRVDSETVEYRFADDYQAFIPYVNDLRDGER